METRCQDETISPFEDILTCSCTGEIFYQPVSTPCNHTFEKEFILEYIRLKEETETPKCPECRAVINKNDLRREIIVEKIVEAFLKENPSLRNAQYFPVKHVKALIQKNDLHELTNLFNAHPEKLNVEIDEEKTILHLTIKSPIFRGLIEAFVDKIDLNFKIQKPGVFNESTFLNYAICIGASKETIEFLLNNGVDPSIARADGITPLHAAISNKKNVLVDLLLQSKKDLNINKKFVYDPRYHKNNAASGVTALISAVWVLDDDRFAELLKIPGIDVNLKNSKGESALFIAAVNGQLNKVSRLLQMPGINVEARRDDGLTAAQAALAAGHPETAQLFTTYYAKFALIKNKLLTADFETVTKLLINVYPTVDISIFYTFIESLEHESLQEVIPEFFKNSYQQIIKKYDLKLLNFLLNIDKKYLLDNVNSILAFIIKEQNYDALHYILENFSAEINLNTPINQAGDMLDPPLYVAARHCREDQTITKYLLEKGASINPSPEGASAILVAANAANEACVNAMLADKFCVTSDKTTPSASFQAYKELFVITRNCSAATLLKFVNIKRNLLQEDDENLTNKNPLLSAIKEANLAKIKILFTLPKLNCYIRKNEQTILQMLNKKNPEMQAFFNCYFLLDSVLSQNQIPSTINLDAAFSLDQESMQIIAHALAMKGFERDKISYLLNFIMNMNEAGSKSLIIHNYPFFKQNDSDEIKMLNTLFEFAHKMYYKNKINWEVKIRQEAVTEILEEAQQSSAEELSLLKLNLHDQPIVSTHRFFLSFGKTRAQQLIERTLSQASAEEEVNLCKRF